MGLRATIALPLVAGVTPRSAGTQFRWRLVEVRARQVSRRSDEYSARSRCYSMHTVGENEEIHKAEKNTMQGAFTLLSYPMYCAPRHIRVLRSPHAPSSHLTSVPRLRQNSELFHDLVIFKAGPAPLGGDRYNYVQD